MATMRQVPEFLFLHREHPLRATNVYPQSRFQRTAILLPQKRAKIVFPHFRQFGEYLLCHTPVATRLEGPAALLSGDAALAEAVLAENDSRRERSAHLSGLRTIDRSDSGRRSGSDGRTQRIDAFSSKQFRKLSNHGPHSTHCPKYRCRTGWRWSSPRWSAFSCRPSSCIIWGTWRTAFGCIIASLVSYMNLLDLGLRGAVTRFVSKGNSPGRSRRSPARRFPARSGYGCG